MNPLPTIEERRSTVNSHLEMEVACEQVGRRYAKAVAHWDLYTMASLGPQLSVLKRLVREQKVAA